MSSHGRGPEVVELSLRFAGLDITVRGPPSRAADFVHRISSSVPSEPAVSSSASTSSVGLFVVPEPMPAPSVEDSFDPCPGSVLSRARTFLKSTRVSPEVHATRAWVAGQWAKACLSGRVDSVPATPSLDFPTKYWATVRSPRCRTPRLFAWKT